MGFIPLGASTKSQTSLDSNSNFIPFHISREFKDTNLEGARLRRKVIVLKEYPQMDIGSDEKLIIDLTMSINIWFLLSATPFCYGVPSAIN